MPKDSENYSDKEAAARLDAIIKRMIVMPPKPHSKMKIGKKEKTTAKKKQKRGLNDQYLPFDLSGCECVTFASW